MSQLSREAQWQTILELSHSMAVQADAKAWDTLQELETRRRQLLASYFANPPAADETAALAADLRTLLDIDRHVMTQVLQERDEIGTALRAINSGRHASQAYAKASA